MNDFKGYSNKETFVVAVHVQNNPALYYLAQHCHSYGEFVEKMRGAFPAEKIGTSTPDGVKWNDPQVSHAELNGLLRQIKDAT